MRIVNSFGGIDPQKKQKMESYMESPFQSTKHILKKLFLQKSYLIETLFNLLQHYFIFPRRDGALMK